MDVGIPKEIKNHEYRVALTPAAVREVVRAGHRVLVESGAGLGAGFEDTAYQQAGATVVPDAERVFGESQLIVKVKEPQANERARLRAGQVLFTFLHLAPDREQTVDLLKSGATCIAYETVSDTRGGSPLLAPMSEVAGRMAVQAGAGCLEKARGGRGVLLGGVPGVEPGRVVIIGGGVVGSNAAVMAVGFGADVCVLDRSLPVLRNLDAIFQGRLRTRFATHDAIAEQVAQADLVIGGVYVRGAAAPKLVTKAMLSTMKKGAVMVDVAIDQGGCFETSVPTTHAQPTYVVDDIVHYCVANMPGAVPRTSTFALTHVTLPHVLAIAAKGVRAALQSDEGLMAGLNVHAGELTCREVGESLALRYREPKAIFAN